MSRLKSCFSVRRRQSFNHTKRLKVFQIAPFLCPAACAAERKKQPRQNSSETQPATWRIAGGGPAPGPATVMRCVTAKAPAWILQPPPRPKNKGLVSGLQFYLGNRPNCPRSDLAGSPLEFPPLKNVGRECNESQVAAIVRRGGGRMPAFTQVGKGPIEALAT